MVFQCINILQVPWEVLKTAAFGPGFQHLPRDLANVNAWKTMFDPYIIGVFRRNNMSQTVLFLCAENKPKWSRDHSHGKTSRIYDNSRILMTV